MELQPDLFARPAAGAAPARASPGALLARGVCRHLRDCGVCSVVEFVPARGLRVDVMALGPRGALWIIECKSGRADFQADRKWPRYRDWCDRLFFAVGADFPRELLPEDTGLMVADGYGAEILREGAAHPLPGARRRALIEKIARHAALRLQLERDPALRASRGP